MSHFTTVQTKIKNVMRLVQTLKELNFKFTQAKAHQQVHVKGYLGQTQEADICIHASDKYEIGIKINAETGTAEFFADEDFLEMHAGYNLNDFRRKVMQRYAYHTVKEEVVKRGYTLEEEKVDEENHIHVTVSSWGD